MISGPRNLSTAMMYSFGNRKDTAVVDEPFYSVYLRLFGVQHPGRKETLQSQSDVAEEVWKDVIFAERPEEYFFIKNMAHHIDGYDYSPIFNFKNVFLIRNPKNLISSFSKVIARPTVQDIGLKREVELYDEILKRGHESIVLDSGEILKDPEKVLRELCLKLDVPFSSKMLRWKAGPRKEDGVWAKYWYSSVQKSTGFAPQKTNSTHLEKYLLPLYEEVRPNYEYLFSKAIKA